MHSILKNLKALWTWIPFRHVFLVTLFLFLVKEQYPFSNFPMYSALSKESDVLFITDQNDEPLALRTVFGVNSSTEKKKYMTELKAICNPHDRDTKEALEEEHRQAGEAVLNRLFSRINMAGLKQSRENVTSIRLYYKTFTLEDGSVAKGRLILVAERKI